MQMIEALRWVLSRLNKDSGTLDGRTITESYVPGVKIGIVVL